MRLYFLLGGDNMTREEMIKALNIIDMKQNAIMDMLSNFMNVYANQHGLAIENVEEECEYINEP